VTKYPRILSFAAPCASPRKASHPLQLIQPAVVGSAAGPASRARASATQPNGLLEEAHHVEPLDTRETPATVGADQKLEAVGEIHGAANSGR